MTTRLSLRLRAALLGIALTASLPAAAQIYSWTDAEGVLHYSSEKPPRGTRFTTVDLGPLSGPISTRPRKETRMGGGPMLRDQGLALKVATLERCAKARETIASLEDILDAEGVVAPDTRQRLDQAKAAEVENCT